MTESEINCLPVHADPLRVRDQVLHELSDLKSSGRGADVIALLRRLNEATIDETTIEATDPFLRQCADGRRIVASFDPARAPGPDEVVIIYGNYPHMFENIVVNNPVKRHVSDFWRFNHDVVESDRRWSGVDKIYVINTDARKDRLDSVLRELAAARSPLDRTVRVRATEARWRLDKRLALTIACLESHIEVLKQARAERCRIALILEDDFCFTSDLERHLGDLETFTRRAYDFWICLLSASKYGPAPDRDDLLCYALQPCTNAGAYLASRDGIEVLLPVQEEALKQLKRTGDRDRYAADRYWTVLQQSGKFLQFKRKFGFQAASFSDIERTVARYFD